MAHSLPIGFSAGRVVAAVVASLMAAALLVQFDPAPGATGPSRSAGEAMMQMLRDEHAAIGGYLAGATQAQALANQSADRDLERMKVAAMDEAQPTGLRLARTVPESKAKSSVVRVAAKPEPVRVLSHATVAAEPLQLLAMTEPRAVQPPPAPGVVRVKLRQLASTVERIPSWFNAAAGWVVDVVPVPKAPSLPELPRHFRV